MATITTPIRPTTPSRTILSPPQLSPSRLQTGYNIPASHKSSGGLGVFSPVDQNGSFCFDREIKSGKVNRRVKNKGAWKPSWKSVYLVLRPNLLSIYQNEDETDLKASITLSEVTAVALVRKVHTDNVFGVFSPSKNHHFQGSSARDTAEWVAAIRAETATEEDDDLDLMPPQFSYQEARRENTYESSDMSADDQPLGAVSPDARGNGVRERMNGSHQVASIPRSSNLQEYSGNENFTTSHSDFSDALGTSLPQSSTSFPSKGSVLTPIASSGQLPPHHEDEDESKQPVVVKNPPPSNDPVPDPERVIRHGHLQILKSYKTGVKGWKSIWVVLRARSLAFYKNEQEYAAMKIFNMDTMINAAEIDPISKSKKFCFQIIMEDKSYRFCAPNDEDLARWLGALKSVLAKREAAVKAKAKATALNEATAALSIR